MIVPGSANPLLMAQAGDPLDELGKIDRSVRFRSSATVYLSKAFAGAGSNVWTFNKWIKRAKLGAWQGLLTRVGIASGIWFNPSDQLVVINNGASAASSAIFRDPAAHLNLHVTSDGTTVVVKINGVQVLSYAGILNGINSASTHTLCGYLANNEYFDGNASNAVFVDGQVLTETAFVQTHPRTGQLRPRSKAAIKAVVDAGGVNSFFLPFDDPTNTTTLCADASANENNWTANNISLTLGATYDSVVDTPTNNYVNLNAIDVAPVGAVTQGGLAFNSNGGSGSYSTNRSSMPLGMGGLATYYEFIVPANRAYHQCGFVRGDHRLVNGGASNLVSSSYPSSIAYFSSDGGVYSQGSVLLWREAAPAPGDIIMLAHDPATNKVWIGLNGTWLKSGQPALGTGEMATLSSAYQWHIGISDAATQDDHYMFGQAPLHASATWHAEARGYFRYAPPAGFKALCAKNLPVKPTVVRASDAFVAKTDSGANIVAAIAAAAPWTDWLRIYKRRDAAEGWRWQFSDDPGSYLDSSNTAAKAAFPALTGSSYVAYALKVAAANGVATGRLNHVTGVTSIVADNLGNSRKLVILKNEATGVWFVYHPELTAGKLLYLNSTAAETTDNAINTVTANDFKVASALASGTYRWVAIAEVEGFTKLGKYLGNGAANGAMSVAGLTPGLTFVKNSIGAVVNWMSYDTAMNQGNPAGYLSPSLTVAEANDVPADIVSNGLKMRATSNNTNQGGSTYVTLSIAAFPFRYANAK